LGKCDFKHDHADLKNIYKSNKTEGNGAGKKVDVKYNAKRYTEVLIFGIKMLASV